MTPADVHRTILGPGLDLLVSLGGPVRNPLADILLLAISGQESNWEHRAQHGSGPARGLWQFERMGGVAGVLQHRSTAGLARKLCVERNVTPESRAVWTRLAEDDLLAAGFARLLLWTDPNPLPTTQVGGWNAYIRTWRPGKPHLKRWARNWKLASEAIYG